MANTKQARKRARQNDRRRVRNRLVATAMRTSVKNVRKAIDENDVEAAQAALGAATRRLDMAASKGVIHKNQAARKIGRLVKAVNKLKAEG
jgi:small subunit ribosomal protein S20